MTPHTHFTATKPAASPLGRVVASADATPEGEPADTEFADLLKGEKETPTDPEVGLVVATTRTNMSERSILPGMSGDAASAAMPQPQKGEIAAQEAKPGAVPAASATIAEAEAFQPATKGPVPDAPFQADLKPKGLVPALTEQAAPTDKTGLASKAPPEATPATAAAASVTAQVKTQGRPDAAVPQTTAEKRADADLRRDATPDEKANDAKQTLPTAPRPTTAPVPEPAPQITVAARDTSEMPGTIDASPSSELELRYGEITRSDPARAEIAKQEAARGETARAVSGQLVEAIKQGRDGRIDVSLNPEELGRVRLTLAGGDAVMHVTIQTERPETNDLLRRHIAQLQQDFQDLGYVQVSIDFGQSSNHSPDRPETVVQNDLALDDTVPERAGPTAPSELYPRVATASGMDLRL